MASDEQTPARPRLRPAAQTEAEQRRARQAAALRENLRRRKARERLRGAGKEDPESGSADE